MTILTHQKFLQQTQPALANYQRISHCCRILKFDVLFQQCLLIVVQVDEKEDTLLETYNFKVTYPDADQQGARFARCCAHLAAIRRARSGPHLWLANKDENSCRQNTRSKSKRVRCVAVQSCFILHAVVLMRKLLRSAKR